MKMFPAFRSLILSSLLLILSAPVSAAVLINGAGATFPYPLYSKWFMEYNKIDPSVKINYQSIGSGGGIKQVTAQTVDFGASDKFLSDEELQRVPGKLLHIPTVLGAVVLAYNIPGVEKGLRLSPEALADIYLGRLTKWNDKRITRDNPGLALPDAPVVVVRRSDGSGTTNIFTDYLSSISREWGSKVGKGSSVKWPAGLGGKGNEGVAGMVKTIRFSIGYIELAYAVENKLPYAFVKNKTGNFIEPTLKSTTAAAASTKIPTDFRVSLVNQPGAEAYPISGFTWLLVYQDQKNKLKGKKLVEFLKWELNQGQKMAEKMLYAPLPRNVARMVEKTVGSIR